MSSTHGPAPEDDANEESENEDRESEEHESKDRGSEDRQNEDRGSEERPVEEEPTMDIEKVFKVLDAQAWSLHSAIQSAHEVAKSGQDLPHHQIDSIRMEIGEFQSAVEDLLTEHCEEAIPWENTGEYIPDDVLDDFVGGT